MFLLLSYIGWSFLPSLVTSWILTFYYRLMTRAGDPRPRPDSPRYRNAYRRVNMAVIALYLLSTIYESYHQLRATPNFYALLNSPITAGERDIKSRFRRLTVLYHPDKVGTQGESYFVQLKQAYDVLNHPVKRAAYDRFGPDIVEWRHCSSAYDYLVKGGMAVAPYYLGGGVGLVILSVLGKLEFGRYWRFFTFFCLMVFEALVVTRPHNLFTSIPILQSLLPFEQLALARKITLTTSIAISQLGPLARDPRKQSGPITVESLAPQLDILAKLVQKADNEASAILTQELLPFDSDPSMQKQLKKKLQDWIVESMVGSNPEVRNAIGEAIQRRWANAPTGANGKK